MTYPTIRPEITLDFANSRQLDPRITFSRSSSATYLNPDTGLITLASEHEARFEKEGLLIEESRTNSQKWSSDFSQTSSYSLINNGDGAVPVLDSTLYEAPDGSATAQRWTLQITDTTDGGNQSGIQAGTSGIPSGAYVTVWAKSATGADQTVFLTSQANDTFTVTSKWQRFDLGPRSIIPFRAFARGTYTNAVVDILLWGVQIEAGSFPTSLIPTSGSTVTRSADIAQITGDNLSSWWNASEWTIFTDVKGCLNPAGFVFVAHDQTPTKRYGLHHVAFFEVTTSLPSGGIKEVFADPPLTSPYTYKAAVAKNAQGTADANAYFNGLAGDIDGPFPCADLNPSKLEFGYRGSYDVRDWLNGHISRLTYYSRSLSNAELETLTL